MDGNAGYHAVVSASDHVEDCRSPPFRDVYFDTVEGKRENSCLAYAGFDSGLAAEPWTKPASMAPILNDDAMISHQCNHMIEFFPIYPHVTHLANLNLDMLAGRVGIQSSVHKPKVYCMHA